MGFRYVLGLMFMDWGGGGELGRIGQKGRRVGLQEEVWQTKGVF